MPSFIDSQRRNLERLLALLLLWNVVAGAFVTLGAPWLSEVAGTTGLRPPSVLPEGSGWLVIGVPTHFAGIWLPVLGVFALRRMRRQLQWHLAAVLFYAAQIFAIASPVRVDLWIGMFAATSLPQPGPAIAVNWVAIALFLIHAWLWLLESRFRAYLVRVPAGARGLAQSFWGTTPLSRAALSRRFASIAMLTALVFLPWVPSDAFYPRQHPLYVVETHSFGAWFDKEDVMFWRRLLLLPITFAIAYAMAFVGTGLRREPRFSGMRGVAAALLSFVGLALAAELLSRWLSGERNQLYPLFVLAWVYLLPQMLLIPAIGAITGTWLGRKLAASQD